MGTRTTLPLRAIDLVEHETQVDCHRCQAIITVSGYVDDLPNPYLCLGCRTVKREPGDPIPYNEFPPGF